MHHASDLRKGRFSSSDHTYLVTAVTHRLYPVFSEWHTARLLIAEMSDAEVSGCVQSLAWVVMPDHFHWLFTLQSGTLAELMRKVKGRSAANINRQAEAHGTLWQKGFHDHALRKEEDLQAVARYVVENPLRAGLVEKLGDYPLWDAIWIWMRQGSM